MTLKPLYFFAAGLSLVWGPAWAAAPDWSKVSARSITLLYPGVSPMEWTTKGTEHGGARAMRKGTT